jgi:hypothetical protein
MSPAHDKIFMKAGMDMIEQTLIIAEIVRVLPSFLAKYVHDAYFNLH